MTTQELFKAGYRKFKMPKWNDQAYAELYVTPDGGHYGPWVTVHDVGGFQEKVLITQFDGNEYLPVGEPDHITLPQPPDSQSKPAVDSENLQTSGTPKSIVE